MVRYLKYFTKILWILLSVVAAYMLTAFLLSWIQTNPPDHACTAPRRIFVTSNGVHLYLILPADAIAADLRAELAVPPETTFVAFGWGDRAFYRQTPTWADLKPGTAFRALFLKSASAMHVAFYSRERMDWRVISLCPEQFLELHQYLSGSFRRDEQRQLQPLGITAGYGPHDFFYEGTGNYSCFRTSNVWVNQALKRADVPTAVWSPFDWGVLWHVAGE